jgi:predicted transcriptional regulator
MPMGVVEVLDPVQPTRAGGWKVDVSRGERNGRINDIADRKRVTRSAIVEAAVESFLSPDHADMQEAALTRRLDRLSRQVARLKRDQRITTETLALFVRFWLIITPPIGPEAQAALNAIQRKMKRASSSSPQASARPIKLMAR